jgi:ankyrin repeat protein
MTTCIFELARNNDFEAIEKLILDDFKLLNPLSSSPIINDRDDYGRTALHICATYGCEESAQKLISLGADLTLQDFESGWTPLHR